MPPKIDVHSHQYPDTYLDACRRPDSGLEHYYRNDGRLVVLQDGGVALAAPQPLPTVADRLQKMDDVGVGVQLLSVSAPNVYRFPSQWRAELTRDINDELVDMARESGGRFKLLASLPLPDVDAALAELERVSGMPEVCGVFLCTTVDRRTLDDAQFAPVFEELSRRETPVLVHPTTPCCTDGLRDYAMTLALDFLAETTNAIGRLVYSGTFERFRGIRWVFTHLGGSMPFVMNRFDNYYRQFPECSEHIDRPPSEILRDIYVDTVTTHVPAIRCALDTLSVDQLVFGTDYPHVPGDLRAFVAALEAADLSEDDWDKVTRRTAAGIFGIDVSSSTTAR